MTTFNRSFDWDTNIPSSISSLDENDFLLLLQKQFPVVSAGANTITPDTVPKERPMDGTNPQSLAKFALPSATSPPSLDSSPSPPSPHDDGSPSGSSEANQYKRSDSGDDEQLKRKATADSFDDDVNQPSAKTQHVDHKTTKAGSTTRRKSLGGEKVQDESRLLKRKEQNRAAQRAFRERKEKHVKDLEDKVAQLEAKTESQAAENDNLRDMLGRLQNENMVLKQTAFTFSVPPGNSGNNNSNNSNKNSSANDSYANSSPHERQDSSGTSPDSIYRFSNNGAGPSSMPQSARSSVRTASTHDSPSSLFETYDKFSGIQHSESQPTSSAPAASTNKPSSPDMDMAKYFGSTEPFTTISSNPMFTSYQDPMLSMNAFASFGGWDTDMAMANTSAAQETTGSELDGLFGDQFSGLIPFSDDLESSSSNPSATARLSPVTHKGKAPGDCPMTKEDIAHLVATGSKSTFGSPPTIHEKQQLPMSGPDPTSKASGGPMRQHADYDSAVDQAFGIPPKKGYPDKCNIDDLCLEMRLKCGYGPSTGSQ